jgi:ADP-ribose pyrophosphatase YjhB (NUDIX family)
MKEIVFNNEKLSDENIQIFDNKVKVILKDSKDELLICKRNGVIHFIGGKIENNETYQEASAREIAEETGIIIPDPNDSLKPFLSMKQYKKNYYNSGKNCILCITYLVCNTDDKFDYNKRNLDEYESKECFTLDYIPMKEFENELDKNREIAKKDKREFIIDEMKYIFKEYVSQQEKDSDFLER